MSETHLTESTPSVVSLVGAILEDAQKLVRQEVALARCVIAETAAKAKTGVALLSSAHQFSPPAEAGRNGFAPPTPKPQREGPTRAGIFEPFQNEIDKAKGIAIGYVMGLVREAIKESVPQFAPKINDLVNALTTKLGGEPSEWRSAT